MAKKQYIFPKFIYYIAVNYLGRDSPVFSYKYSYLKKNVIFIRSPKNEPIISIDLNKFDIIRKKQIEKDKDGLSLHLLSKTDHFEPTVKYVGYVIKFNSQNSFSYKNSYIINNVITLVDKNNEFGLRVGTIDEIISENKKISYKNTLKQNNLNLTEELFDSAVKYAMHIFPQVPKSKYSSIYSSYDSEEDSVVLRSIANIIITVLAVEDIEDFNKKAIKQENLVDNVRLGEIYVKSKEDSISSPSGRIMTLYRECLKSGQNFKEVVIKDLFLDCELLSPIYEELNREMHIQGAFSNISIVSKKIRESIINLENLLERLAYILDRKHKNTK
jgi:hypothetical protein